MQDVTAPHGCGLGIPESTPLTPIPAVGKAASKSCPVSSGTQGCSDVSCGPSRRDMGMGLAVPTGIYILQEVFHVFGLQRYSEALLCPESGQMGHQCLVPSSVKRPMGVMQCL